MLEELQMLPGEGSVLCECLSQVRLNIIMFI